MNLVLDQAKLAELDAVIGEIPLKYAAPIVAKLQGWYKEQAEQAAKDAQKAE